MDTNIFLMCPFSCHSGKKIQNGPMTSVGGVGLVPRQVRESCSSSALDTTTIFFHKLSSSPLSQFTTMFVLTLRILLVRFFSWGLLMQALNMYCMRMFGRGWGLSNMPPPWWLSQCAHMLYAAFSKCRLLITRA